MFRKFVTIPALALLAAGLLSADFSYQETSKITGGAMAAMMNVAGIFSKNAREPIVSTVAVKGDRMVRKNSNQIQIMMGEVLSGSKAPEEALDGAWQRTMEAFNKA